MDYLIKSAWHGKESAEEAQRIFERYCEDLKNGKVNIPTNLPEDIVISPETFKMCYADLPEDNIFRKCRAQMPLTWFYCDDGVNNGIILSFSNSKGENPRRLKDNSSKAERRSIKERQYKINSATRYVFRRKQIDKDTGEPKRDRWDRLIERPKTLMNYVIYGIIYASEGRATYILDRQAKEWVKEYGLEAFGVGNSGNEDDAVRVRGQRGLIVDGREIIKPDDMLDVHHIKAGYNILPDMLELMPHWLHVKCAIYTASTTCAEEYDNLIRKAEDCRDYIEKAFGSNFVILDMSKGINDNIYIHYDGINKRKEDQATSSEYRYYKIFPFTEEMTIDFDNKVHVKCVIKANRPLNFVYEYRFITAEDDKEMMVFITYFDGDTDLYKKFIERTFNDLIYQDIMLDKAYKKYKNGYSAFSLKIRESEEIYCRILVNFPNEKDTKEYIERYSIRPQEGENNE